jgi:hypothetical protein
MISCRPRMNSCLLRAIHCLLRMNSCLPQIIHCLPRAISCLPRIISRLPRMAHRRLRAAFRLLRAPHCQRKFGMRNLNFEILLSVISARTLHTSQPTKFRILLRSVLSANSPLSPASCPRPTDNKIPHSKFHTSNSPSLPAPHSRRSPTRRRYELERASRKPR